MCSTCFSKQCRLEALYNLYFGGGEREEGQGGKGKKERGERRRGKGERGDGGWGKGRGERGKGVRGSISTGSGKNGIAPLFASWLSEESSGMVSLEHKNLQGFLYYHNFLYKLYIYASIFCKSVYVYMHFTCM